MTLQEELKLVKRAKDEAVAFKEIYEYYSERIFKYCLNRLPTTENAEDVTSIVFIAAIKAIKKFDTSKNIRFGSWLYRTANNKISDYYRKNSRIDPYNEEFEPESKDDLPEEQLEKEVRQKQVISVLALLNPRYQEVLSLSFFEDMKVKDIAELLSEDPKKISVVLFRAQKSFRIKFKKTYPESEIFNQ